MGVYDVVFAIDQRDFEVRCLPAMHALLQRLGHSLAHMLLIAVENLVIPHDGRILQAASHRQRFDFEGQYGPAGLGHGVCDVTKASRGRGFLVDDDGLAKLRFQPPAVQQQAFQHFQLYLAHDADVQLPLLPEPLQVQRWVFVGQLPQRFHQLVIFALGSRADLHPQKRRSQHIASGHQRAVAQYITHFDAVQAIHRRNISGGQCAGVLALVGVDTADLADLLRLLPALYHHGVAVLQATAVEPHMGGLAHGSVMFNLIYHTGQRPGVVAERRGQEARDCIQQLFHAHAFECRAEKHRE